MSQHPIEPESLLQLYVLLAAIADPVRKLSSVFTKIQSGCAASDRIFFFMDKQPRVSANCEGPAFVKTEHGLCLDYSSRTGDMPFKTAEAGKPMIEFKGVCFSYDPGRPIVSNINLSIYEGETVAILGHNGSGKSTLMGMIPRFYDPDHGTIFLNGEDLRNINLRSLRKKISVVTQETVLLMIPFTTILLMEHGVRPRPVSNLQQQKLLLMILFLTFPRVMKPWLGNQATSFPEVKNKG